MKSIIEIFHAAQESQQKIFAEGNQSMAMMFAKMHPALEALDIARALYGEDRLRIITVGWSTTIVAFKVVKEMAEVGPLLDVLEQKLGIVFDRTEDRAESNWREFHAKDAPWIRVDAELTADTEHCHREVVGYEQTPVYKLVCDDAPISAVETEDQHPPLSGEEPTP